MDSDELGMQEDEYNLSSNPGRAIAARIIVGCIGGLLIYSALPLSLEGSGWWDDTARLPFIGGVIALALAVCAPARWCELLIP